MPCDFSGSVKGNSVPDAMRNFMQIITPVLKSQGKLIQLNQLIVPKQVENE